MSIERSSSSDNGASSIPSEIPSSTVSVAPWIVCVVLSIGVAIARLGPVFWSPSQYLVGGWGHPDNIGNHWLLVWVAERLMNGESILHNTDYYVPIGDYPWLAGNGTEGVIYALFHSVLGWPTAVVPLVVCYFLGMGLATYALARIFRMGPWASLVPAMVMVSSGFWTREMNAGRFSQLDGVWLLLSLALFVGLFTNARSKTWATLCGVCIGLTGIFYWYYAYFFVLSAVVFVLVALVLKLQVPWRNIAFAAGVSWLVVSPIAYVYWQHWHLVPGVSESVFPSPDSYADAMTLSGSLWSPFGRTAGAVQSMPTVVLIVLGVWSHLRSPKTSIERRWAMLSVLGLCLLFGVLSFGPKTPLFSWVYGWAPPLRRFWWPSRHLLLWTLGCAVLAGFGAQVLIERVVTQGVVTQGVVGWKRPLASMGLCLLIPIFFWIQGDRPFHANHTPLTHPISDYEAIGTLEGEVVLMPPLNPKIANTQLPLLFQLSHQKRLLTGHGMWVDRVRPESWDDFMSNTHLLNALSTYELGSEGSVLFIESSDLEALWTHNIDLVVLDAKVIPRPLMGLVPKLGSIYVQLFGDPIYRGDQIRVWSTRNWTGNTEVELPPWNFSDTLTLGNGRHRMPDPVVGRGVQ